MRQPITEETPQPARAGNGTEAPGPRLATRLLVGLVAVKVIIHLALANRYGYFRDELYFLDCGRHLDWGYVDHAPLIGLIARIALELGGSLPVLRAFPALAGAAMVALTVVLAWRLGGGRFAQGLAGLTAIVAPIHLGIDSVMSMNAFEPLFWIGSCIALVRLIQTGNSRLWLLIGILCGLGLLNKHSTVFFAFAVALAVLATPLRRELRTRWLWLGAGLALLIFLPNLLWQWTHGFPTLEDLRNVRATGKNVVLPPLAFFRQQILMMHPVLAPLWLYGLWELLAGRLRRYRALGIVYLALLAVMIGLHGKDYYLAPAYPLLLAAGAVGVGAWLASWRAHPARLLTKAAMVTVVAVAGALTAPLVLPLLSPERYVAYQRAIGVAPQRTEVGHVGALPQLFGDQFGWPELVADVARVYRALPESERARACIFAGNYGEAGAINLFGPKLGLPRAISGHQTHFLWGPSGCTGEVIIALQDTREGLEQVCSSVEEAGQHFHPWGMAEENGAIWVCRGLKQPLEELWPRVKHWN